MQQEVKNTMIASGEIKFRSLKILFCDLKPWEKKIESAI